MEHPGDDGGKKERLVVQHPLAIPAGPRPRQGITGEAGELSGLPRPCAGDAGGIGDASDRRVMADKFA